MRINKENSLFHQTNHYTVLNCRPREENSFYLTMCGIEQCTPGYSVGPRTRDHFHLHVILSGKGRLETGKRTEYLHAGQAFLLKPMETAFYQADREEPWRYCWITFDGALARRYMEAAGFTEGVSTRECYVDANVFLVIVERLLECADATVYNEPRRTGLALEFISLMLESAFREKRKVQRRQDYSPDVYVDQALDMIHMNYAAVRIGEIARYIGINRSYLTKIFKEKMGVSPQAYLLRYRLELGSRLLLATNSSIQEVALKAGYENPLTFSRMFKSVYGVSPRNYRLQRGVIPAGDAVSGGEKQGREESDSSGEPEDREKNNASGEPGDAEQNNHTP